MLLPDETKDKSDEAAAAADSDTEKKYVEEVYNILGGGGRGDG